MALKTNSKQAIVNIRQYIIDNFDGSGYTDNPPTTYPEIATFIYNVFKLEKWHCKQDYQYYNDNEYDCFCDWCYGLPNVLDTCYCYNRSAISDLGNILQENDNEKSRYTEKQSTDLLTYLIYREIKKVII